MISAGFNDFCLVFMVFHDNWLVFMVHPNICFFSHGRQFDLRVLFDFGWFFMTFLMIFVWFSWFFKC